MKNLFALIREAKEYAENYALKYAVTDEELLEAIYVSHLAYLVNQ